MKQLLTNLKKKRLKDTRYSYLFEKPSPERWVSIDCEMTGLNPKTDHILSVAAVAIEGNRILSGEGLHIICRPPQMPTADTIRIHGLRPSDVEYGIDYPTMFDTLMSYIGSSPIIGYHIKLDLAFLNILAKAQIGQPLPNRSLEVATMFLHKQQQKTGAPYHDQRFEHILETLAIPDLGAHSAYNDALMTAMIFTCLN